MRYLLAGLESERIHFEYVNEDHKPDWLLFLEDPETQMHWFEPDEPPDVKLKKWYDKQALRYARDLGGMNALIEKASGKFIGHAGLLVQTVDGKQELEIGYSLMPHAWGKGFATEAAQFCKTHAFTENFSESLISIIAVSNEPSKRVASRNGMTRQKTTSYHQNPVDIYRIRKSDWLLVSK